LDDVAMYRIPGLTVEKAIAGAGGRSVILKTSSQAGITYVLTMVAVPARTRAKGIPHARAMASPQASGSGGGQTLGIIPVAGPPPVTSPPSKDPLRVVSATSTSNTEVRVQFSEPMSDRAPVVQYYEITPDKVNPEAGRLIVKNARFQEFGTETGKVV